MSIYINLLNDAVSKNDLVGTRSRICNLLLEKKGFSGTEIMQIANEIEKRFESAGMQLYADVDENVIATATEDLEKFRQETANLSLNFSSERLRLVCTLKDRLFANQEKDNKSQPRTRPGSNATQNCPYTPSPIRSNNPSTHQKTGRTHRKSRTTTRIGATRGAVVGGVVGIVAGAICHSVAAGVVIGVVVGGVIGYACTNK